MTKSITFVTFLLSISIAQVAFADDNDPWILPGLDKNEVQKFGTLGQKCWQDEKDGTACLTRTSTTTKLLWKKHKPVVTVSIEIIDDGENIVQSWRYNGDNVHFRLLDDGSYMQLWKFGPKDQLHVSKSSDGTSQSKWSGVERPEKVEEFKKFIDSWCENNDYFVGKDNCAVYAKTKINTNPAWIIPGFDKNQKLQPVKPGKKCWQKRKYLVCWVETETTKKLYWYNGKYETHVTMEIFNAGLITQEWLNQGNFVSIRKLEDGSVIQQWQLGSSKFEMNKNSDGTTKSECKGTENLEALKSFQQFIESWCKSNNFLIENEKCLIYRN